MLTFRLARNIRSQPAWLIVPLCLLVAGLYVQLFQHELVWDEHTLTTQQVVTDPSWAHYQRSFQQTYRPLVLFSIAIDRAVWRGWPPGYPLDSLLYHLVIVLLVFRLCRRWLKPFPSIAAASIVALHPVGSETINYLLGRPDQLATLCMLAALLALERAQDTVHPGRPLFAFYLFSLLALLSKETALLLAGFALIMVSRRTEQDGVSYQRRLAWISPLLVPPLMIGADRLMHWGLLPGPRLNIGAGLDGLPVMAATAWKGFQLVWLPVSLCPWYEGLIPPADLFMTGLFVFSLAVSLISAWQLRDRAPGASMGIVWVTGTLLLIAARANSLPEPMNPLSLRWLYPCVIGMALIIGSVLQWAELRWAIVARVAAVCGLALLIVPTWQAAQTWRSDFTLYDRALACNPDSAFLTLQYIRLLERSGRQDEAKARFATLVDQQPMNKGVLQRQVRLAIKRGDYQEALVRSRELAEVAPSALVFRTLGDLLALTDQSTAAIDAYHRALQRRPRDMLTVTGLGSLLERERRWPEAGTLYQNALSFHPKAANLWFRLGRVREVQEQLSEASEAFAQVMTLDPYCPDGHLAAARLLDHLGDKPAAEEIRRRYREQFHLPLTPRTSIPPTASPCGAEPVIVYRRPAKPAVDQ